MDVRSCQPLSLYVRAPACVRAQQGCCRRGKQGEGPHAFYETVSILPRPGCPDARLTGEVL